MLQLDASQCFSSYQETFQKLPTKGRARVISDPPLKPGFHIIVRIVPIAAPIVSKCVQAIGTIIWKCSKKIRDDPDDRDDRDRPDRQHFYPGDRDDRKFLQAIKWKPLSDDRDDWDDRDDSKLSQNAACSSTVSKWRHNIIT